MHLTSFQVVTAGGIAMALSVATAAEAQTAPPASVEDGFKVTGSVRMRYEALDGDFRPGFRDGEDLVSIRTILGVEYRHGPIHAGVELWDSRAYDDDPGSVVSTGEVNTFEPVQAWVAADLPGLFGKGSATTLKAGRFTLDLGSRRLIAADEYRNTTNGFTGVRADFKARDGTNLTLIYVLPQTRMPDTLPAILDNKVELDRETFDTQLWGGLLTKPHALGKTNLELGYYGFLERDAPGRPTRNRHLQNLDARLIRDPAPGKIDYEIEGIYQSGTIRASAAANAAQLDVSANFVHADLGYSFADGWRPHLSIEFDRASGDGSGANYGRFDSLYGMRRADFAPAGLYNALTRTNMTTVGIRAEVRPDNLTDAFVTFRPMWLTADRDSFALTGVRGPSGAAGSFAGNQLEGRLRRWIVPAHLRAELNAVWLAKGRFLKTAPNAPRNGDTHYASFAVTASF